MSSVELDFLDRSNLPQIHEDEAIAILASVFLTAIEDVTLPEPPQEVIRWFISDEIYTCSFIHLCQVFNFSPIAIRQRYKQAIYRQFLPKRS
jgi:hypothetical protein